MIYTHAILLSVAIWALMWLGFALRPQSRALQGFAPVPTVYDALAPVRRGSSENLKLVGHRFLCPVSHFKRSYGALNERICLVRRTLGIDRGSNCRDRD